MDNVTKENLNGDANGKRSSRTLRAILKSHQIESTEFFENIWQKQAVCFPYRGEREQSLEVSGEWRDDDMRDRPFVEALRNGWHILKHILEQAEDKTRNSKDGIDPSDHPLVFQNRELKSPEEIQSLYGSSLYAPYLDGCSVVLNHGELLSPWIAYLCQDLQEEFPHVYANCYLTPPDSQAVPPHADDRDVFVLQLVGSKEWKVYERVPIPYPYTHEQVGKDGLPIPPPVLNGPLCINTTLYPGDVLYMPRGFVHQAHSPADDLSFHITIALATHDWTFAGIVSMETERILTQIVDYRQSILPVSSTTPQTIQRQLDQAMTMFREEITAESILSKMKQRLEKHNQRAGPMRMSLLQKARFSPSPAEISKAATAVVGPLAVPHVTYTTQIRASTPEERGSVITPADPSSPPRGLQVRESIHDSILSILDGLRKIPDGGCCRVQDFRSLMPNPNPQICDFALLCFAKRAVELGALAIVHDNNNNDGDETMK
eukprot:scaffold1580_cov116-Cylindrotheca_fusiformis.AAC.2